MDSDMQPECVPLVTLKWTLTNRITGTLTKTVVPVPVIGLAKIHFTAN